MSIEKRLERLEAILDARGLDWDHPKVEEDHFADANKMVVDEPAKEAEPAWEPKVGDWVLVTRPVDWKEWDHPRWECSMHEFDGRVGQIERGQGSDSGIVSVFNIRIRGFVGSDGTQHYWHRKWLSPAEPPKPPEPEYREPVLPADAGKYCQFSDDGIKWRSGWLNGWVERSHQWIARSGVHWQHARIKKDA